MTDGGTRVVRVSGLVDERWSDRVVEAVLSAAGAPVVVDLSDAILVSRSPLSAALRGVLRSSGDLDGVSIVCPRISAAMLLKRWGIAERVPVYPSFDALDEAGGPHARATTSAATAVARPSAPWA